MILSLKLILVGVLLSIGYQDVKHREVSLVSFILLLLASMAYFYFNKTTDFLNVVLNVAFLSVELLLVIGYLILSGRKVTKVFAEYLGLGDIVFLFVMAPLFTFPQYVFWFILTLMGALVIHMAMKKLTFYGGKTIPLAGIQALISIPMLTYGVEKISLSYFYL